METNKQLIEILKSAVTDYQEALDVVIATGWDYYHMLDYFYEKHMYSGLCKYFGCVYYCSLEVRELINSIISSSLEYGRGYLYKTPRNTFTHQELCDSLQFRIDWMKTQIEWLTQQDEPDDEPDARDFMEVRDDEEYINKINNSLKQ